MVLTQENINRLVIYFFYDKDGIVDRYVPYLLKDMRNNCSEIFVVVNGMLTLEGRRTLEQVSDKIMVRDNKGFDVWAYKEAMEQYGWDGLAQYDEVVLMNHTIMGPIYPFSEMFAEMNKVDVDFWGINIFHKTEISPCNNKYGYIPDHLQSHFICVRNKLLASIEFHMYWDKMGAINSYDDAINNHEMIFTKTFSDMGYKWKAYIDTSDMKEYTNYPLLMCPEKIITEKRCPIFKRRSFFHGYTDYLTQTNGSATRKL